jgi:hypothetical protein
LLDVDEIVLVLLGVPQAARMIAAAAAMLKSLFFIIYNFLVNNVVYTTASNTLPESGVTIDPLLFSIQPAKKRSIHYRMILVFK